MRLPVALVQLDATDDVADEHPLCDRAGRRGRRRRRPARRAPRVPAVPRTGRRAIRASARPIPGEHTAAFAEVARRREAWILVGSLAESSDDPARPHNTSVLIGPDGAIAATYRKIHLFDVAVDAGPVDTESARVSPVTGRSW